MKRIFFTLTTKNTNTIISTKLRHIKKERKNSNFDVSAAPAGDSLHAVLEFAEGAIDDLGLKLLDSLWDGNFQLIQRLRIISIDSRHQVAPEEKVAGCEVGVRGGHSVGPRRPMQFSMFFLILPFRIAVSTQAAVPA